MKKHLAILLTAILLFISAMSDFSIQAADSTGYSVKVGKKITLSTNLKNAVWGSDDISIAIVSKKGVVKGVSAGTCTIVATADGKSELFLVKVTKAKKKTKSIKLINEGYLSQYITLSEYPVVVFDGIEITLFQSDYTEIYDALSQYTSQNKPELDDILTGMDTIELYKNDKFYAAITLIHSSSKLAKDAKIVGIELGYPSSSNCYYYNKNFKIKNMPDFNSISESALFSSKVPWIIQDWNDNNYMFKHLNKDTLKALPEKYAFCYCSVYAVNHIYSPNILFCVFDVSTHECIFVTMIYQGTFTNI